MRQCAVSSQNDKTSKRLYAYPVRRIRYLTLKCVLHASMIFAQKNGRLQLQSPVKLLC